MPVKDAQRTRLMKYPIIQPPFTLVFPEMSKNEIRGYNEWFHNNGVQNGHQKRPLVPRCELLLA